VRMGLPWWRDVAANEPRGGDLHLTPCFILPGNFCTQGDPRRQWKVIEAI
jgi:hypothetical protein